jgi:hypothetical protein
MPPASHTERSKPQRGQRIIQLRDSASAAFAQDTGKNIDTIR